MNLSNPALAYVFLVIPTFFGITMIGQGIQKITKQNKEGPIAVGFGVGILLLIAYAYVNFIR
jgi:hypothetical protein